MESKTARNRGKEARNRDHEEFTTTTDDPIERMIWHLQPDNKARYPKRFKVVLDFLGLKSDDGPEALRKASIKFVKMVREKPELVEDRLRHFIIHQYQRVQNGEIKPITIRNYIKAVKLFCENNRITKFIEWKLISKGVPRGRPSGNDRAPTAEEIRKMIGDALRLKVIVCIMSSCGIRLGAWNYLKVKHITAIRNGDVTLAMVKVYAGQDIGKRREYQTLISPEAYQAFQEYLASRKAAGEKITGESWVVRDEWQTTNIRRRHGWHGGNYGLATVPIQLTALGVKKSIEDTLWSKGIRVTPAKHHEFKGCHGFRKYFKTYAQRTMRSDYVERLLGHTGDWSDAAYNRPLEDWIIEAYLKAVPDLTIFRETNSDSEAVIQLTEQMESKDKVVNELQEQVAKMQTDLQDIKEFELKRLRDPSYLSKKTRQEVEEEMKQTGKDLITVLAEKMTIEAVTSPKMMESIKKLPLTTREVVVQKLIALAKRDRGYDETHPEIKKIKTLVDVDVDVDTYDIITEEDLRCYRTIQSRFDLEEERSGYHLL